MLPASGNFLIHNGIFIKSENFSVSLDNEAFKYGSSIFEPVAVFKNRILFKREHLKKIKALADILGYSLPLSFNIENLDDLIMRLLRKNKFFSAAFLHVQIYKTQKQTEHHTAYNTEYLIEAKKTESPLYNFQHKGLKIGIYKGIKKDFNTLSGYEASSLMLCKVTENYCKIKGFDKALILNSQNCIVESSFSNIFAVKANTIYTPPLAQGCIDGVMKKVIIRLAKENDFAITEHPIKLNDLKNFDELFLTDINYGIDLIFIGIFRKISPKTILIPHSTQYRLPNIFRL